MIVGSYCFAMPLWWEAQPRVSKVVLLCGKREALEVGDYYMHGESVEQGLHSG